MKQIVVVEKIDRIAGHHLFVVGLLEKIGAIAVSDQMQPVLHAISVIDLDLGYLVDLVDLVLTYIYLYIRIFHLFGSLGYTKAGNL